MDKETLSNYGWIVICVLVLAVMIALATPFGTFVADAVKSTTQGLFDVNQSALNSTGLINIGDQSFGEGGNGGQGGAGDQGGTGDQGGADTNDGKLVFTIDGTEYNQYTAGKTWGQISLNATNMIYDADGFLSLSGPFNDYTTGVLMLNGERVHRDDVIQSAAYTTETPVTPITYEIIEGAGQTVTTTDASFRSNADYNKFDSVKVDNNVVDPSNYTISEGSTIVTFNGEYLATLSNGTHTLEVVSNDGSASCEFTVKTPVELITFTIDGEEYQAEEGMTWGAWLESDYNIENTFIIGADLGENKQVYRAGGNNQYIDCDGVTVSTADLIIEGIDYNTERVPHSGGAG